MFTTGAGIVRKCRGPGAPVAVIGAGPAGLAAALSAAARGADVTVYERLPEAGRRLLATGGGHCNFTNTLGSDEFAKKFGPAERFVSPALKATDSSKLRGFLEGLGVPAHTPDGLHVFPVSNSAAAVRDALVRACRKAGVQFRFNSCVTGLEIENRRVAGVKAGPMPEKVSAAVLAAGGASRPELGGGKGGLKLAAGAGHAVVEPCPALVPLLTREKWPGTLAGVTVPMVVVRSDTADIPAFAGKGALLFTHRGISGPAVLDISGAAASALKSVTSVPLTLDLAPDITAEQWRREFDAQRKERGARVVLSVLRPHFPDALARVILDIAGVPADVPVSRMLGEQGRAVIGCIGAMPLTVTDTEGMKNAMASRGGVALGDIDRKTMESRLVLGLFFAGEVIDVDGPCGGFNLHWAFASGLLAGAGAAGK